jgi:hypothetical protein
MSEVTPGIGCFTGAGEWLALGAGAFVTFVATAGGGIDGTLLAFDWVDEFASDPPVMYGWLEGVIAGSSFVLLALDWVALETLGTTDAVRELAFAGRCRKYAMPAPNPATSTATHAAISIQF